jgi:hypothetical protein
MNVYMYIYTRVYIYIYIYIAPRSGKNETIEEMVSVCVCVTPGRTSPQTIARQAIDCAPSPFAIRILPHAATKQTKTPAWVSEKWLPLVNQI